MTKQISIDLKYEKAIKELNSKIEEVQELQKELHLYSNEYREGVEKELKLQREKLQLIQNHAEELSNAKNKSKSPATRIIEALKVSSDKGDVEDVFYLVKSLDNLLYSASKDNSYLAQENYDSIKKIISKLEGEVLTFTLNKLNYDAVETLTRCIGRLKSL